MDASLCTPFPLLSGKPFSAAISFRTRAAKGSFKTWLLTLARNSALDHVRLCSERQRRNERQVETEVWIAESEIARLIDDKRQAARIRAAVGELSCGQRRSIELAYFEGLTHAEIAVVLRKPLGTVKSWIRQGLLDLRAGLALQGE